MLQFINFVSMTFILYTYTKSRELFLDRRFQKGCFSKHCGHLPDWDFCKIIIWKAQGVPQ